MTTDIDRQIEELKKDIACFRMVPRFPENRTPSEEKHRLLENHKRKLIYNSMCLHLYDLKKRKVNYDYAKTMVGRKQT